MRTNTNRLLYLGITGNIYNSKSVAIHGSGSWQDQRLVLFYKIITSY